MPRMNYQTIRILLLCSLCAGCISAQTSGNEPSGAQDSSPPVAECRRNGDLWLHEGIPAVQKLAIADLYSRNQFMERCSSAHPGNFSHRQEWQVLDRAYREEIGMRALSFIARHNLKDKFMQEDAAGTR